MAPAIQVLYKCVCDPAERTITLMARRDDEDIMDWMKKLTQALSDDHAFKSPLCPSRTMTFVKVPIANDDTARIGGPVAPKVA